LVLGDCFSVVYSHLGILILSIAVLIFLVLLLYVFVVERFCEKCCDSSLGVFDEFGDLLEDF